MDRDLSSAVRVLNMAFSKSKALLFPTPKPPPQGGGKEEFGVGEGGKAAFSYPKPHF